jgi:hypothetical protein
MDERKSPSQHWALVLCRMALIVLSVMAFGLPAARVPVMTLALLALVLVVSGQAMWELYRMGAVTGKVGVAQFVSNARAVMANDFLGDASLALGFAAVLYMTLLR